MIIFNETVNSPVTYSVSTNAASLISLSVTCLSVGQAGARGVEEYLVVLTENETG